MDQFRPLTLAMRGIGPQDPPDGGRLNPPTLPEDAKIPQPEDIPVESAKKQDFDTALYAIITGPHTPSGVS